MLKNFCKTAKSKKFLGPRDPGTWYFSPSEGEPDFQPINELTQEEIPVSLAPASVKATREKKHLKQCKRNPKVNPYSKLKKKSLIFCKENGKVRNKNIDKVKANLSQPAKRLEDKFRTNPKISRKSPCFSCQSQIPDQQHLSKFELGEESKQKLFEVLKLLTARTWVVCSKDSCSKFNLKFL